MTAPASPPAAASVTPRPLAGREWLAARASLAARRTSRFARLWSLALGAATVLAFLLPLTMSDPHAAQRAQLEKLVVDTLRTAQRVRRGEEAVAAAESLLAAARPAPGSVRGATRVTPPAIRTPATRSNNPAAVALGAVIADARRLRTVSGWLAVVDVPAANAGPRMRALGDTLRALSRQRDALPAGPQRDQQLDALTPRIGRIGYTILSIAEGRLAELEGEAGVIETAREAAPAAPAREIAPDTAPRVAALGAARDSLARARQTHDSLGVQIHTVEAALAAVAPSRVFSMAPGMLALLVLVGGLLGRFGTALRAEMRRPTLAHATEAERSTGSSVVTVVREGLIDGPARYRPSGVDPFRMLYLGLTATGTRARTAIVTGSDPVIAAAVGGRLAIAAAADHRTTLVVDLDPAEIALSRAFRARPEPGLTDVLAGAFKWREVARPVGSSDGLLITLVPAGTERDDLPQGEALEQAREEFTRFRAPYELTILVANPTQLDCALALVERTPLVHCASTGATEVESLVAESAQLRAAGFRVHGIVLWDAERPSLPSRAELAAHLTKQKGRTPGGSFEAVQKAVSKPPKQQ